MIQLERGAIYVGVDVVVVAAFNVVVDVAASSNFDESIGLRLRKKEPGPIQ